MKKLILVCTILASLSVNAQEFVPKKYLLTTITDEAGISVLTLLDAYLSPLTYTGAAAYYQRSSQKLFSADNLNLSHETKLRLIGGLTYNNAFSAGITHVGGSISWGPFYHFKLTDDLRFRVGGNINAFAANNDQTRNVNNPVNFDFNTNLNAAAEIKYKLKLFSKQLTVFGNLDFPFAGVMFVPRGGISYYQLVELGDFDHTIHFSSFHNRQGLNISSAVEIPFKYTTWRFGLGGENVTWKANDMIFKRNEFKLSIAIKYDIRRFSGTKNIAPENFLKID